MSGLSAFRVAKDERTNRTEAEKARQNGVTTRTVQLRFTATCSALLPSDRLHVIELCSQTMSAAAQSVRCLRCRAVFPRLTPLFPHLARFAVACPRFSRASLVPARHFASSRPADTRVDVNLTANRPPIDALFAAYHQSPSLQTLTPLLATLNIHQHLFQLSSHLRVKLSAASATASLFFSPTHSSTSASPSTSSHATAAISFAAVSVQQLDDEVLSERIVKTFTVQPHSVSPATAITEPIIVESDWRTERNKVRGMGVHSYSMRVLVHVPLPLTSGFPSSLSSAASILLSPDYASFVLTDSHDAGVVMRDAELVSVLPVLMGMGGLTEAEWVWLMSVLCVHPSDVAFDVLSAALATGDRD